MDLPWYRPDHSSPYQSLFYSLHPIKWTYLVLKLGNTIGIFYAGKVGGLYLQTRRHGVRDRGNISIRIMFIYWVVVLYFISVFPGRTDIICLSHSMQ